MSITNIKSGPALTIAGLYAKRMAWGPIWVGIRIITIIVINAGPLEVRGPLRPHTLQWPKAGPAYNHNNYTHTPTIPS